MAIPRGKRSPVPMHSSFGRRAADARLGDMPIVPIQFRARRSALPQSPRLERPPARYQATFQVHTQAYLGSRPEVGDMVVDGAIRLREPLWPTGYMKGSTVMAGAGRGASG